MNNSPRILRKEEDCLECDNCKLKKGFVIIVWDTAMDSDCPDCNLETETSYFFCMSCATQKRIFETEIIHCESCYEHLGVFSDVEDPFHLVCPLCNHDFVKDSTEVNILCLKCRMQIS